MYFVDAVFLDGSRLLAGTFVGNMLLLVASLLVLIYAGCGIVLLYIRHRG